MKRLAKFFVLLGIFFVFASLIIIGLTFYPLVLTETKYIVSKPEVSKSIEPVDSNFAIIIPKIGANVPIIANVDPFAPQIYQKALTKGVAHALGSSFPGNPGNVFIFAHSAQNFYQANRYNAVFYLLNKLELGDEIYLYYQKEKFLYKVTDKKIVEASEIEYFGREEVGKKLTIMTCWPPGTTLKRQLVIAEIAGL